MNKDFQQLRRVLGGSDPFVNQGHQIVALRKNRRVIPDWARSNAEVQKILLRSFPKLAVNQKQRNRAARWARVIHLYYRLQWTYRQVAAEIKMKPDAVHDMIKGIRRVAKGVRVDNSGLHGVVPRGRPRKALPR